MENVEIARVLRDVADLLEIQGANPFRVRAYRGAAKSVEEHPRPLRKLVSEGADLTELPAIGKDMAGHIAELVERGELSLLLELAKEVPLSLIDLTRLPGLGAKRTRLLWGELDITTVDGLEAAAQAGEIEGLPGFGKKTQQKILESIERFRRHQERMGLAEADLLVLPLVEHLRVDPNVKRIEVAGSYRRRKETVGDIDVLVAAENPKPVMERFVSYRGIKTVEATGDTKASAILKSGLQVDLRVVPSKSYGAALAYFTGSKEHNVKLRLRAVQQSLRVSEYGVFRVTDENGDGDPWAGEFLAGRTEAEVYGALGLGWIPPELREDRGEIKAAVAGELPDLITVEDIRGDLQMHSTWSDGKASLEAMAQACIARGYGYFAITDHSKALGMTGGMDSAKLREQWKEIEELAARYGEIRILRGMEVDILADGKLDLEDEMLAELDVVVLAVHSRFDLPEAQQTERIVTALQHPEANILAHPTARLINRRDPILFDMDAVLECASEFGVAVEHNAHPDRLDLSDINLMRAKARGVQLVINTDAHSVSDLELMQYGIEQARRAWLTRHDVLNTLTCEGLLRALHRSHKWS